MLSEPSHFKKREPRTCRGCHGREEDTSSVSFQGEGKRKSGGRPRAGARDADGQKEKRRGNKEKKVHDFRSP